MKAHITHCNRKVVVLRQTSLSMVTAPPSVTIEGGNKK